MPDGKRYGYDRTVCACAGCSAHCTSTPGVLAPGDFEQIAENLRLPLNFAMHYFRASPGATVLLSNGSKVQIPTITPRVDDSGACVFLRDGRCEIHADAPYGCSHFDDHMSADEGNLRSLWVHQDIATNEKYHLLRECLVRMEGRESRAQEAADDPDDRLWDKAVDGVHYDLLDRRYFDPGRYYKGNLKRGETFSLTVEGKNVTVEFLGWDYDRLVFYEADRDGGGARHHFTDAVVASRHLYVLTQPEAKQ